MSRPFRWNRIPTAVWAYGFLRAASLGAPLLTEGGQIPLLVLVVLPVYVFFVRGSRVAWAILVVLDAVGLLLLAVSYGGAAETPISIPLLTLLAFATLLLPPTRRWVGAARPATD